MKMGFLPVLLLSAVALPAEIHIYGSSQLQQIQPLLFGSGDEIDEDFVPYDLLLPMIDQTGVTLLRMGGIANEYYDWEGNDYNGVRYLDLVDTLIVAQNVETSMDDFLDLCEQNGIEPVLSVNFQLNDPEKAARLVEYCNGDDTTPMGSIRAQRGHPEPYGVTLWQIGNEPDISGMVIPVAEYTWTLYRHFGIPFDQWQWNDSVFAGPEEYAQLADVYANAMRAASPIPIEIATISLAGNLEWLQETLQTCEGNTDWLDLHYYPSGTWEQTPPDTSDYIQWLSSIDTGPMAFDQWYQAMKDSVDSFAQGDDIPVCIMEYNAIVVNPDLTWWNYVDGLFVADALGHLAEQGCPMAGVYSIFEGSETDPNTAFGMIRGDSLSPRATAWVMKLFSENLQGTALLSTSDASGGGYGMDVHASLRPDGKLCVMVVNKHLTQEFETEITLHGYISSGYAEVYSIENDSPMEAPFNGTTGIQFLGGLWGTEDSFERVFPRASVTCLLIHPQGSGIPEDNNGITVEIGPSPAGNQLVITYHLERQGRVRAFLYDLSGRLVELVANDLYPAGSTTRQWSRGNIPNGVYLLRVCLDGSTETVKKLVLS